MYHIMNMWHHKHKLTLPPIRLYLLYSLAAICTTIPISIVTIIISNAVLSLCTLHLLPLSHCVCCLTDFCQWWRDQPPIFCEFMLTLPLHLYSTRFAFSSNYSFFSTRSSQRALLSELATGSPPRCFRVSVSVDLFCFALPTRR